MNAPQRKRTVSDDTNNLSNSVLTKQTRCGFHRTVEDVESRRRRRNGYISTLCALVKRIDNTGFKLADFKAALAERSMEDITLYRHNDLVETFTAVACKFGIVFFRDSKDTYYVDDTHALCWGLSMRPKELEVAAGSQRGLKQQIKQSHSNDYDISSRAAEKLLNKYGRITYDADVIKFCSFVSI